MVSWGANPERELHLYARAPERVWTFAEQRQVQAAVYPMEEFGQRRYDLIVNCIGIASPRALQENPAAIFPVTACFDDLILAVLEQQPEALYLNLSSGAVYGTDFRTPADEESGACFAINNLQPEAYYGVAKLHAEARHRSLQHLQIVDLRIFGYFSRYIDLQERFLLSELIACVQCGQPFVTTPDPLWRDFLHPRDLVALIEACVANRPLNGAYDAYSAGVVSKAELIEFFVRTYGLQHVVDHSWQPVTATGMKERYYSTGRRAAQLGYQPVYSSLEGIRIETDALLRSC